MHAAIISHLPRRYSIGQVIELTSEGRSTIWRKVKQGKFPPGILLARTKRVWSEAELAAYLNGTWSGKAIEVTPAAGKPRGRPRKIAP